MRLKYTANPPSDLTGEDAEILARVQARRRGMGLPLIPLDLTLLHAPKLADGIYISLSLPHIHTALAIQ